MQKIYVDPSQLDSAASRIESQNQEYERIYNSLYSEVDKMSANWQGKDNLEFTNRVMAFKGDFRQWRHLLLFFLFHWFIRCLWTS